MLEVMFPWMLDDFVFQACYELKRKIPHMASLSITLSLALP